MNPAKAFAIALKRLRTAHGLTQEALAHEASLSLTSLARIETAVQEPKIGTVLNLAKAMKISGAELVAEVERVQREASAYELNS
jgi:XRE family transcriptional regulator, regulator of sulfur utilization